MLIMEPLTVKQAFDNLIYALKSEGIDINKEEPKPLDTYEGNGYMITSYGVDFFRYEDVPKSDMFNCFHTKESAEQARKHLQITCALLNFRAENDKKELDRELDWRKNVKHWHILSLDKDYATKIDFTTVQKQPTCIYFSSKELAQSALDMLKRKGLV